MINGVIIMIIYRTALVCYICTYVYTHVPMRVRMYLPFLNALIILENRVLLINFSIKLQNAII